MKSPILFLLLSTPTLACTDLIGTYAKCKPIHGFDINNYAGFTIESYDSPTTTSKGISINAFPHLFADSLNRTDADGNTHTGSRKCEDSNSYVEKYDSSFYSFYYSYQRQGKNLFITRRAMWKGVVDEDLVIRCRRQ